MGLSKQKPARRIPQAVQAVRILLRPQNRGPVLAATVLAAALAGALYAWQRWGEPGLSSAEYLVTPDKILATPQPVWIRADVKADVVRTANLAERNLRDPRLVEEVAAAFALHPWVAAVSRVEKRYPARIEVALEYRRPVAVVEISGAGEAGLLFIDAGGVLLPSEDFAPGQTKDYLRIAAGGETPAGIYGTASWSERILGAARIAAAWEGAEDRGQGTGDRGQGTGDSGSKLWQKLGLYRIVPVQSSAGGVTYELRTERDARVLWGSAPGSEAPGEPPPEQKIAKLQHLVADKGPLDREGASSPVDLRR
ncbi:MAG TPA: hypothetical protein VFV87_13075 [Pirellulaceae bacterium]|nr:hypothetical protein [Pirellulaceae bacterium]